jgi:hypothetical protein
MNEYKHKKNACIFRGILITGVAVFRTDSEDKAKVHVLFRGNFRSRFSLTIHCPFVIQLALSFRLIS